MGKGLVVRVVEVEGNGEEEDVRVRSFRFFSSRARPLSLFSQLVHVLSQDSVFREAGSANRWRAASKRSSHAMW